MGWLKSIKSAIKGTSKTDGNPTGAGFANKVSLTEILDQIPPGSRIRSRHWSRIRALHKKADDLERAGKIMEARTLSVEALQLAMEKGGPQDPGVGACFFHFARGVENAGDLTGAEQNYNAAYGILEATEGEATPLKAEVLLNYGLLYMRMRLGWRAILILGWAKAHFEALYGPEDENVGRALMGMAMSHEIVGDEDAAIARYDDALRIIGQAWGATHPSVAYTRWARADLAFWRAVKGGDDAAVDEELDEIRAGLEQLEREVGQDHPVAAERRAHLGSNLIASGREAEGASLLTDAIAILETAGQPVPGFRRQLAPVLARLGKAEGALTLLQRAFREDGPIGEQLAHGSERERGNALEKVYARLELFLDVVLLADKADDPAVAAEVGNLFLSYKALGAELLFLQRQAIASREDPEMQALRDQLAELRARQAALSLAGGEYDAQVGVEIERVEWELASRVPEMDAQAITSFTHESAAGHLPPESVLIEFVSFTRRALVSPGAEEQGKAARQWYVAFAIPSDVREGVRLVDLGPADTLNGLIRGYLFSLGILGAFDPTSEAGGENDLPVEDDTDDDGVKLRKQLLDPLWPFIRDRRRVFIAPDGELTWFPFEILPGASGRYLIEMLDISYLSVGRDLERLSSARAMAAFNAPVVLADPDYDSPRGPEPQSQKELLSPDDLKEKTFSREGREQLRDNLNRRNIHFRPLPGTRSEGMAIASILGVEPLLGEAASEKRLKAVRSPLILHVATHGFYFPAPTSAVEPTVGRRGDLKAAAARNPLVRSGIVLSGVNSWLSQDAPPDYIDDGILTGEDVVAMDLGGTEMVVLYACQTGLGDLTTGEGVVGLRRAFMVAGARTLVLSLWSVPDQQTQLLMTYFYEALLSGEGRAAALRQARQRVRAKFPDPFFWAAFVCVGDPEPIGQLRAQKRYKRE